MASMYEIMQRGAELVNNDEEFKAQMIELDGDIVFIKNIDNVVQDRYKDTTYTYKKALGGYLVSLQKYLS